MCRLKGTLYFEGLLGWNSNHFLEAMGTLSLKKGTATYLKDRGWAAFRGSVRSLCGLSSVNLVL